MKSNIVCKVALLFYGLSYQANMSAQNCRVDSIYSYTYNDAQKTKSLTAKNYITYNADGNKSEEILYTSSDNGKTLKLNVWHMYTYTDGHLSYWQIFARDQANKIWRENRRLYYMYNNQNKVTDFYSTKYEAGSWLNDFYDKTAYDIQGRKLTRTSSGWDPEGNRWYLSTRDSSLYDNNNREQELITAFYLNEVWVDGRRQTFLYNNDGQYSESNSFMFSLADGKWSHNRKWSYSYNESGLLTEKMTSAQRPDNKDWYDFERTVNQYTAEGCLDNFHYYLLDYASNTWPTHTQEQYVFPVYDPQTNPLTVFPNPAGLSNLHFLAAIKTDYYLIDMNGKNVMEGTAKPGDNEVGVQHLSAGLYVLRSGSFSQMVLLR